MISVNRDKCELGVDAWPASSRGSVLSFDSDFDFHRCTEYRGYACLEPYDFTDVNRLFELQTVDECSDSHPPRMALRANGRAQIDPTHDLPTEDAAKRVGVLRKHVFGHLCQALRLRTWFEHWTRGVVWLEEFNFAARHRRLRNGRANRLVITRLHAITGVAINVCDFLGNPLESFDAAP